MESLTEISKSRPHAAYVAFTKRVKSKFTYYLRLIISWSTLSSVADKGQESQLVAECIPIEEHGLPLNKQEFTDSLCLRYNLPLPNLPTYCACADMFTINPCIVMQEGGFMAQRHDTIWDLLPSQSVKCTEM